MTPRQAEWQVAGLTLRGLEWGEPGDSPVLALHGWQDNAASFAALAQRLPGHHVVAPDLSGQGLSDFRSQDASYNIWDDLPQLVALLDTLGWERCALVGHSRGAIIATLLAAALPERCRCLLALDGMIPGPVEDSGFAAQLGRFLHERERAAGREPRRYPDREAALEARMRGGLPRGPAEQLAERGLLGDDSQGWYWRIDPRLRGASAVKMNRAQIHSVLAGVSSPVMLLLATGGVFRDWDITSTLREQLQHLRLLRVEGEHHFHMNPGPQSWEASVRGFLAGDEGGQSVD